MESNLLLNGIALTFVQVKATIIHEGRDAGMRYWHRKKMVHPLNSVYLLPENSPFLTDEVKLFAYCEDDDIAKLYAFVAGVKTSIPKILRVFAKTVPIRASSGTVTLYSVPVGHALNLANKTRYVVLQKSNELINAVCLQALGKLAGYLYFSEIAWNFNQRIAEIAKLVCNRDFPEIPPMSFNLDVLAVLEPYYKLSQFIKPTELAKLHLDFADMVDRTERFLSTNDRSWNGFVYRTVLSLASFLKKQATASGFKEVIVHGAAKAFAG